MTNQQLQQLAREYANYVVKDFVDDLSKDIIRTARQSCEETAHEILRWLSSCYCIVEKNEITEWINTLEIYMPTKHTKTMLKIGAKALFGKELFNEDKQ